MDMALLPLDTEPSGVLNGDLLEEYWVSRAPSQPCDPIATELSATSTIRHGSGYTTPPMPDRVAFATRLMSGNGLSTRLPYTTETLVPSGGGTWTATLPGVSSLRVQNCAPGFFGLSIPPNLFTYPTPSSGYDATGCALLEWDTAPQGSAIPSQVAQFPQNRWLAEGGNLLPQYFVATDGAGAVTYVNAATLSSAPHGIGVTWPGAEVTVLQWAPPACLGTQTPLGAPTRTLLGVPPVSGTSPVPATEITPLILDPYLIR